MTDTNTPAADTAVESDNIVTIEDKGPALKEITIEIPAEKVQEKIDESLATFRSEAQIPGFRKGRVPARLIEKKFGKGIRDETKNQLVASAYSEAIEQHKLRVLGEPDAEELKDLEIEEGKPLKFSVTVEVTPEFDLPDTKGIKVIKPIQEVTEEMVQEELEAFCLYHGSLETIEGEPEEGAYLTGHGIMKDENGEVLLDLPGAVVQIPLPKAEGKGAILGVMVDDFAKQLGKPKPGDKVVIKCTGPESHEDENVRGKKLEIEYTVEKAERVIPIEVEELLAQFGMTEESQLREQLKLRLEQRIAAEQANAMRAQVAKFLLDNVEMDLPEKLTAAQTSRNLERKRMELLYQGVAPDEIEKTIAEARTASEETAKRELKALFITERLAELHEIQVNEGEVNARIAQLAATRGMRPEQLKQEMINTGRLSTLAQQIREHKVLDQIIKDAEIEEMPAEEYNKTVATEGK